ncbi:YcxB family protein [Campylobacter concisus]|uniref:YcxB family protein n=2 Tax=Campylobacter concisus TaxID=199 RepID=UPI000D3C7FF5|nr:YcxB family protein [Campylobacter concisus]
MKCNIVLSGENLIDYQAFNLFFSKKARKQYFINVFMIFTEAIIAGFIADMLLKTKIFTIIGIIFAIFWIIFYPIFLKNRRKSVLKSLEISDFKKEMIFEVDEKNLAFYENEPKENEIFDIKDVSEIYELKNIFVIFINEKIYLIIPKSSESLQTIQLLAKNAKKPILKFENLDYKSVMS